MDETPNKHKSKGIWSSFRNKIHIDNFKKNYINDIFNSNEMHIDENIYRVELGAERYMFSWIIKEKKNNIFIKKGHVYQG